MIEAIGWILTLCGHLTINAALWHRGWVPRNAVSFGVSDDGLTVTWSEL